MVLLVSVNKIQKKTVAEADEPHCLALQPRAIFPQPPAEVDSSRPAVSQPASGNSGSNRDSLVGCRSIFVKIIVY